MELARVLIIADDLTGALDSSVAFAERGLRVVVALTPDHLPQARAQNPDVIAVSTGSREMQAVEACAAVSRVCEEFGRFPGVLLKKVDSRLKGPVSSEVDTLSEFVPRPVIAAPAIPRLGRFVIDGAVTGNGVAAPIDVAEALGRPAAVPDIRSDADFDAALPDDIEASLFVGAAGMAEALARRLVPEAPERTAPRLRTPLLAAIGSRDPVTLAQVAALEPSSVVRAPNGAVPEGAGDLAEGQCRIIQMVEGVTAIPAREAEDRFSQAIVDLVERHTPATLFACGGESAAALLRRLGAGLLELRGEALVGIPLSRTLDGPAGLDVLTKSGGFGAPDTLLRLLELTGEADVQDEAVAAPVAPAANR